MSPIDPLDSDNVVEMSGDAQLEAWNGTGAMKSFNSAEVEEPAERALTVIEP